MKALRCGLLPGESQAVVERLNRPLQVYLERRLGLSVKLLVGSNYVATVDLGLIRRILGLRMARHNLNNKEFR
ncbi:hypothetical protein [Azotobacter armeniacus]